MPGASVSNDEVVEHLAQVQSKQRLMTVAETDTPTEVVSFQVKHRRLCIYCRNSSTDIPEKTYKSFAADSTNLVITSSSQLRLFDPPERPSMPSVRLSLIAWLTLPSTGP